MFTLRVTPDLLTVNGSYSGLQCIDLCRRLQIKEISSIETFPTIFTLSSDDARKFGTMFFSTVYADIKVLINLLSSEDVELNTDFNPPCLKIKSTISIDRLVYLTTPSTNEKFPPKRPPPKKG